MKAILLTFIALFATPAFADAVIGKPAPEFSAINASGETVKFSDYKGKYVVLEWTNPQCPFVKKFYNEGAMQMLQKRLTNKGIIWLSINSSAKGKEGNMDGAAATKYVSDMQAEPTQYLIDADGTVGKLYGAKTTPHMFVIDKAGVLQYAGALDSKPSADPADIADAHNYVMAATNALIEGKKIEVPSTQPYGCNVKY